MNRPDDLTRFASGPLYKEVARLIMEAIGIGLWKPGEAIPPEPRLAEHYGVSIGTLRKAIDALVSDNLLLRQQGRGTFVASHRGEAMRFLFFNLVGKDGSRRYPDVRLESFRRARASGAIGTALGIDKGTPVLEFRNVVWLDAAPVAVDDVTVSSERFAGLTQARLRDRDNTIYHLYQHGFGVSVTRIAESLGAIAAPADIARLLGLKAAAPLLQVHRVAYAIAGEAVEHRTSWIDTRAHEYRRDAGKPG